MKGYKLWNPENKKIVLSKHVTFDEASLLNSTIFQQVKRLKTIDVSQRVEVDATPPPLVGSVSVKILPDVTPSGDHIASFDAKQVEDIDENVELFAAIETKINSRKWEKKHESQVGKCNKLKLMVVVLHDGIGKEVHMTQAVQFAAKDLVTVA